MIIPYLRQDLEIFRGNSREDGAPAWLLYDAVRNKYFTLGLTAFKLIKNWRGGEDIQNFEKKINSDGIETIIVIIIELRDINKIDGGFISEGIVLKK